MVYTVGYVAVSKSAKVHLQLEFEPEALEFLNTYGWQRPLPWYEFECNAVHKHADRMRPVSPEGRELCRTCERLPTTVAHNFYLARARWAQFEAEAELDRLFDTLYDKYLEQAPLAEHAEPDPRRAWPEDSDE